MAQSHFDTIVAPITGTQKAAVSWVRLSGPEAWSIASKVFRSWPEKPESHKAVFGTYEHGDSGLVLPFEEGHSYTGDESVELSLHGSTASIRALVEACIQSGARLAEPGEFTLRAFLNGRLDLTQAEAVRDTVDATTDAQLRAANLNRKGVLKREVSDIRNRILNVLARVEASVDFSEEIGDLDRDEASKTLTELSQRIEKLIATSDTNRILREGYRIAIVGPPNAGKSSLLNALLGEDRSIVTEIPGTTRDYVEEQTQIGGFPVVLIDTAGLRETSDPVESIGIQRTHAIAANADEIWYLFDAVVGLTASDAEGFERPTRFLANKSDLAEDNCISDALKISALTRQGLDVLLAELSAKLQTDQRAPLINLRHQPLLGQANASLEEALTALSSDSPDDLLSVLLAEAAHHLGAITGETAMPDMIDKIFHDFCIGK